MTGCTISIFEVSIVGPVGATSRQLFVKWLQACCIPVAMLLSSLLLLRRPSHGAVMGWLKDPSPKRGINAGVLSLSSILFPVLSMRSMRCMTLCAAASMHCPDLLFPASLSPHPFRQRGSLTLYLVTSDHVFNFTPTHCWKMALTPTSMPWAKRSVMSGLT